jgi:indolepyruvate ferredoxin oxidoreductase
MLTGYAWQKGLVPISRDAILEAVALNGVAVQWNQDAFNWGRRLAHEPSLVNRILHGDDKAQAISITPTSVADWKQKFATELTQYQNKAYADRYVKLVEAVATVESNIGAGLSGLALAVAKNAHKLMAYKDEYEVARLYASPEFRRKLEEQFEGDYKLAFNLAPPMIAPRDKTTGHLRKMEFGSYMLPAFHWLARLKFLRGTRLDIFGYSDERRQERGLIDTYEKTLLSLLEDLNAENHGLALKIAEIPATIRGYGHVKERNIEEAQGKLTKLLAQWPATATTEQAA